MTTWAPLIVIFGLSAAKEALDDFGRAKQDKIANQKKYKVGTLLLDRLRGLLVDANVVA